MGLELLPIEEKQKVFSVLLYNRGGDITATCKDVGITRRKWRQWIEENEEFAQDCAEVGESLVDLATGKLVENVKKGNSKDIQFLLKTLGRGRGFGEKVEVALTGTITHAHGIKYYPPEPKSIEEWEAQVAQAKKASKAHSRTLANIDSEGSNSHVSAIPSLDAPPDTDTLDAEYTEVDTDFALVTTA